MLRPAQTFSQSRLIPPSRRSGRQAASAAYIFCTPITLAAVFGMIVGAALAHNFGLAGNPDSKNEAGQLVVGGISTAGKVAVIVGLVVLLVIALWNMPKKEATK